MPAIDVLEAPLEPQTPGSQPVLPPECGNPGSISTTGQYRFLDGAQIEPTAGAWSFLFPPRVVTIPEILALTNDQTSMYFVPPYPRHPDALNWEISELAWLEDHRDDPIVGVGNFVTDGPGHPLPSLAALPDPFRDATRAPLSEFLQLDPPGFGSIFNISPDAVVGRPQYTIGNINQQHLRRQLAQGPPPHDRTCD